MKSLIHCSGIALLAALSLSSSISAQAEDTNLVVSGTAYATDTNRENTANADNSQQNTRDRNDQNPTPLEQGNSRPDIVLTRNIRRSVVSETNSFSAMARNIKIITRDGKVTLRGPVKTHEEKSRIAMLASELAGTNNVTDLLEVKSNP